MARKGSRKVRTGCRTCKARKVKCDEGKPQCSRCMNTGRTCDGYASKPASGLLWHRPRQLFYSVDSAGEGRALQFFSDVAGPLLSGATDPYFWTHLVMQFSNFEPAVRHCVVAISSLYEQLHTEAATSAAPRPAAARLKDNSLALQHYNAAIRELKTTENQPLVLLVCILFICIEFLQFNREEAIRHCKHGIALLGNVNYSWAKEHLVPVFRRLSIFPFFFGWGSLEFPDLDALDEPVPESFESFSEAQSAIDSIASRTLQVVRWGDTYRFGSARHQKVPLKLLAEREEVGALLDRWQAAFENLDTKATLPRAAAPEHCGLSEARIRAMSRTILAVRYEVCRIWLAIAFDGSEMCYDEHLGAFRRIRELCRGLCAAAPEASRKAKRGPRFVFETGLLPMLHFVATKCRDLEMRLEALRLIRVLGAPRENLWEADQMFVLARRVVEIEHDIVVDALGRPAAPPPRPGPPPDEKRVRYTLTEPDASAHVKWNGKELRGWAVGFVMRTLKDEIVVQKEFATS
ncbi:hypothetical protein GGS23DRAFT_557858 [Durotheca rogersii]|uniref:uncharacterized protein n=1 Tax=Durotheca rogersii TaxID=419775 RepID=UPI00221EAB02|nr:uncharacterized protein GGS23DRAFT_557858 [Durotheca rogersii]KAI5865137.1 hypothetical protein GGS23DRAFT_557858 [Durotheca rogersii]